MDFSRFLVFRTFSECLEHQKNQCLDVFLVNSVSFGAKKYDFSLRLEILGRFPSMFFRVSESISTVCTNSSPTP